MIRRLLVANRGEIARRIFRTCRSLGITSVAVCSDADASLPFAREADLALRIGPAPADASYLDAAAVLDAARRAGADAIHPGYGFLSENADFAHAVIDAGLTWVGPPPDAMRRMGDKSAARAIAAAHGVPTVTGYDGDDQRDETFAREAARVGWPLLVKAAAGGGGRGMRRVDRPEDLAPALESARREAQAAFGSGKLLLERYVERARHVEVQVFGDLHGNLIHLFERECSIQRRHQKVIEEAPSPAVDAALRERLGEAAIAVARAVDYAGAGTVEFLVDADARFYFLEMNTRLQVEHPVTEAITGLDLVAMQIRVAEGRPLDVPRRIAGHAIEARIYAEDPGRDYLPASGRLVRFDLPGDVRVDAGFEAGDEVGVHYDAMLAKVIAWGETRDEASRKLRDAIERAWVPGIPTNLPLLRQILSHAAWEAGALHTGFLAEHGLPTPPPLNLEEGARVATALAWHLRPRPPGVPAAWRVHGPATSTDAWRSADKGVETSWREAGGLEVDGLPVVVHGRDGDRLDLSVDGLRRTVRAALRSCAPTIEDGEVVYLHLGHGEAVVSLEPRFPAPVVAVEAGTCAAPTPGTVVAVRVGVGDRVERGQALVVLEAMKMEHTVAAPEDGVVAEVRVAVGDRVDQGAVLVRMEG